MNTKLNDDDSSSALIKSQSVNFRDENNIRSSYENSEHVATHTGVYWYRWYISVIFGLFACMQGTVWNTWGPISESALCAFGFTSGEIAHLANWGPIVFMITLPFFTWLLNNKGLRISVVLSSFLVACGCGVRCLPVPLHIHKYMIHLGQILNAIAGPVSMSTPPLISNTWFPPHERMTATSVTTLIGYLGGAVTFLIGPAIVAEPSKNETNETTCAVSDEERMNITNDIMNLLYVEFGVTSLIFICTLIYFPNKPPLPPSVTASLERLDFKKGMLSLLKNYNFIMYALILAIVLGCYNGFQSAIDIILSPLGVTQVTAGNIAFVTMVIGFVGGLAVGWLADKWKRHNRVILLILFILGFLSTFYFTIIESGWINVPGLKFSLAGAWTSLIIQGTVLNAATSIGNELVVESGYPTGEGISMGIFAWINNFFTFFLLLVLGISPDNSYAVFLLLGSLVVALLLLLFFTSEPNTRMKIDDEGHLE